MYFTSTYHFQNSEESHYNLFVDRLANKRRQSAGQPEPRPATERSPSIVLGAGKPIVPPSVNPLVSLEVQIISTFLLITSWLYVIILLMLLDIFKAGAVTGWQRDKTADSSYSKSLRQFRVNKI